MAADEAAPAAAGDASFVQARATLRDTAKWVLSGFGALLILVVGGTTISQFGALDPDDWRFWLAVTFGAIGLVLCVFPLRFALAVLTPESISLKSMAQAQSGVRRRAFKRVEKILEGQLPEGSVRTFLSQYDLYAQQAESVDSAQRAKAVAMLDALAGQYGQVAQLCLTTLVRTQFDELMVALSVSGAVIVPAFLIFAWAANPGKDLEKALTKPIVRDLTPDALATNLLKSAGVASACYWPVAHVVLLTEKPGGRVSGLLLPAIHAPLCAPVRVTVVDDQIRGVD